jgi:hypothetical protein
MITHHGIERGDVERALELIRSVLLRGNGEQAAG